MSRADDGRMTPLDPGIVARVAQGLRYIVRGVTPNAWFGPSQPLQPQAPEAVRGRAFDYPVGFNIQTRPRAYEPLGFPELRALAESWDLLRLVIETRKDQLEAVDWSIRPRNAGRATAPTSAAEEAAIRAITDFLACPDREHDWAQWLRALLEDLFVIDAPALYKRHDRGGRLYALELIDGATIKPVIDDNGRRPLPPDPAYQQVLKGVPAVDYAADELIYAPRNLRAHKVYGFSPVEQIVMTVNVALRRQVHQLDYYTEGSVPEALIGVPAGWTTDQIRQFQAYWDALLAGELGQRRRLRFIPGEMKLQSTKEPVLKDLYDEWLARVVCYAFSVSPLPFVAHLNRATSESAHDQAIEEGLAPLQNWVKRLIDRIIAEEFASPGLEFAWRDDREQDPSKAATIEDTYVRAGIKTINEARTGLGLTPQPGGDRLMVYTGQGYVPITAEGRGGAVEETRAARAAEPVAKYSPDQPRVPAGETGGGQWTTESGSGDRDGRVQLADARPMDTTTDAEQAAGRHGKDAETVAADASAVPPRVPDYRNKVVTQDAWDRFNANVAKLPGVTPTERFAYATIFAAEGGFNPSDHTSAGITLDTLDAAKRSGGLPGLAGVRVPRDLDAYQTAELYRYYFNTQALQRVGGAKALNEIGDKWTAAAVADVLFREGGSHGGSMVRQAVKDTMRMLPETLRAESRGKQVGEKGVLDTPTVDAIKALTHAGYGEAFRSHLSDQRNGKKERPREKARNDYFRFSGVSPRGRM